MNDKQFSSTTKKGNEIEGSNLTNFCNSRLQNLTQPFFLVFFSARRGTYHKSRYLGGKPSESFDDDNDDDEAALLSFQFH